MKDPGIVVFDGEGVIGRSEESVGENALEGVMTCIGDDLKDAAGGSNSMDPTLGCT